MDEDNDEASLNSIFYGCDEDELDDSDLDDGKIDELEAEKLIHEMDAYSTAKHENIECITEDEKIQNLGTLDKSLESTTEANPLGFKKDYEILQEQLALASSTIHQLEIQLKKSNDTNEKLCSTLNVALESKMQLQNNISILHTAVLENEEKSNLANALTTTQKQQQTIESLEVKVNKLQESNEKLKETNRNLLAEVQERTNIIEENKRMIEEYEEKNSQLLSQQDLIRKKTIDQENISAEVKEGAAKLREIMDKKEKLWNDEKEKIQESMNELTGQLEEKSSTINLIKKQIKESINIKNSFKESKHTIKLQIHGYEEHLKITIHEILNKLIEYQKKDSLKYIELKKCNQNLRKEMSRLKKTKEKETTSLHSTIRCESEKWEEARQEIVHLKEKLNMLAIVKTGLSNDILSYRNESIGKTEKIESLQAKLVESNRRTAISESRFKMLQQTYAREAEANVAIIKRLEKVSQKSSTEIVNPLSENMTDVIDAYLEAKSFQVNQISKKLREATQTIKTLTNENEVLEKENQEAIKLLKEHFKSIGTSIE